MGQVKLRGYRIELDDVLNDVDEQDPDEFQHDGDHIVDDSGTEERPDDDDQELQFDQEHFIEFDNVPHDGCGQPRGRPHPHAQRIVVQLRSRERPGGPDYYPQLTQPTRLILAHTLTELPSHPPDRLHTID